MAQSNVLSANSWSVGIGSAAIATVIGASVAYNTMVRGKWHRFNTMPVDFNNQSILLDEAEGVYGSALHPNGDFSTEPAEGVNTVLACFLHGVKISEHKPCLGTRKDGHSPYEWITYREVQQLSHAVGSAMVSKLGMSPGTDTFVCICSKNCKEWVLTQLGCVMFSMVVVPLYETLGADACAHILNQTASRLLFYESNAKFEKLLAMQTAEALSQLRFVVLFETVQEETRRLLLEKCPQAELLSLQDLINYGKEHLQEVVPPKPSDLYSICYTSGTTGSPKGAMILHSNLVASLAGNIIPVMKHKALILNDDMLHFSYLPLAHMFEQMAHACVYFVGGQIGIFRGDVRGLLDDIATLKPTFFCAVPRVLNRVYDKVMIKANSNFISRFIMRRAIQAKLAALQQGYHTENTIWDRLVFNQVRQVMGGRLRAIVAGSAPLAVEVKEFFMALFGSHFFEGYGQTEATSAVTCTLPGDWSTGHVGCVSPCCHIKLVDVPDMDLQWRRDGRGEVCIRGPVCISGYLKLPEKTKELYDEQGWLHTGDIGMWLPNGTLRIVDRCKNIFKLSQGEYVSPEKVETYLIQSPLVSQICVDGNSLHAFCVAVVVPDFENMLPQHLIFDKQAQQALCTGEEGKTLKKRILDSLTEMGKKGKLHGFEMVRDIHVTPEAFTVDNDLLTPTMKVRRAQIRERFAMEIRKLYERNEQ